MNRDEAKENYWWGAKLQLEDKSTLLEPNLPAKRTSLEFYLKYNVDERYPRVANLPNIGDTALPHTPSGYAPDYEARS